MRRKLALFCTALLVVSLVAAARVWGASWRDIVWGALGLLAAAIAASFIQWLVSGGPLRLERRLPPGAGPSG